MMTIPRRILSTIHSKAPLSVGLLRLALNFQSTEAFQRSVDVSVRHEFEKLCKMGLRRSFLRSAVQSYPELLSSKAITSICGFVEITEKAGFTKKQISYLVSFYPSFASDGQNDTKQKTMNCLREVLNSVCFIEKHS